MAYIGKSPVIGNFVKLDAITAVNGQAAYTMQNGGSNFTDYESVNQFLVSLNGTIQAPTDSFTVSGSTLTFASNLSTGDVIDFIMVFGNSLSAGTPTDATVSTAKIVDDAVTAAKINNDIISGSTELATEPADTDEFLVSDAGTLKRLDYSLIKPSSDVVKLNETTHSSDVASISIDGHHTSDYDIYDYIIDGFSVSADSNAIRVRVNMGGSAKTTSDYKNAGTDAYRSSSANNLGGSGDWNQSYFRPNGNWGSPRDTSVRRGYLLVRLVNPLSTSQYKTGFYFNTYENHDNSVYVSHTGGWQYGASEGTAVSGLTFYLSSSGNFTSYRVRLYGVK